MLLTTDLHLEDSSRAEYRWDVFAKIRDVLSGQRDKRLYILGDLTDRADRFTGTFVNRIISELESMPGPVTVLMGNHDHWNKTVHPASCEPFFRFLPRVGTLNYITQPYADGDLILLPWSADPEGEWEGVDWGRYEACFMHQTVKGATVKHGMIAEHGLRISTFPRDLKVYSGDLHVPHNYQNVTYVGAPHPVRFGDTYPCRMLVLDKLYDVVEEIKLAPMRKYIFEVSTAADLKRFRVKQGDQIIVRMKLGNPEQWPVEQQAVREWAQAKGVVLVSSEGTRDVGNGAARPIAAIDPAQIIREYAAAEGLDARTLEVGLSFL